jgi:hypothetical protein
MWFALLLGISALAFAACGDDDDEGGGGGETASEEAPSTAKAPPGYAAVKQETGGSGTPIKVAVLSECKGAFGSFDNQNMAGAVSVRRRQAQESGQAARRLDRRRDQRAPAPARGRRLRRRHVGHGHQGDAAAHGAARR